MLNAADPMELTTDIMKVI
jgi:hypothetical protein